MSYIEELIREKLKEELKQSGADLERALEYAVETKIAKAELDWQELLNEAALGLVSDAEIESAAEEIAEEVMEVC